MEETSRPNIIWVFGGQHRRQLMGCAGDPNAITPNLDNFAEHGIRFTRAYSNFPLCGPARGTVLSGKHGHACIPGHNYSFPPTQESIADILNRNGYRTAWFGKWNVAGYHYIDADGNEVKTPVERHPQAPPEELYRECHRLIPRETRAGFETWIGYENNTSPHNAWVHGHEENGEEIDLHRLEGFETDALTQKLVDYLGNRAEEKASGHDQPFFAALSVHPPHNPYGAPERFMRNYRPASMQLPANVPDVNWVRERCRREYAGACALVENLDWNFGRLRTALRTLNLDKDTLILFFSDHGDMLGSQGLFRKTHPYEESVGVPFIIGGGLEVRGSSIGKVYDEPVGLVDLAPTTLGLCGIAPPDWMHGENLAHFHKRRDSGSDPESYETVLLQSVVATGHPDSTDRPWRGVVTRDKWKYVCFDNQDWLLFDHNTDPLEQVNLAHNPICAQKREQLRRILRERLEEYGDSFPVPN